MTTIEEASVWIISTNPELCERLRAALADLASDMAVIDPQSIQKEAFRQYPTARLRLVILDVDGRLDRGLEVIQAIRKARIQAPMVVMTASFSREFGVKILSQGVRYYFSHDYCEEELREVARSLLK